MKACLALIVLVGLLPEISHAATEYATFESLYKESSSIGWVLAAVVALIAGAVILFTGGTASPIVASIGTWLGGAMGLSGIAATNAGLAMLGGGSIASGGFGIAGGVAILSAALSFGTDVVFDYSIGKTVIEYKYSNLAEQSKEMLTLPLPVNSSGPHTYKNAIEILDGMNHESPIYAYDNQLIISHAIKAIETDTNKPDKDEISKNESLLSLLYFVTNDYVKAKEHANIAIIHARSSQIRRTLPGFIYATSTLYEEEFDFASVTDKYFSYSVLAEPDNPLIPLLFSIYLDRMMLRYNDGYLNEGAMIQIFNIMKSVSLDDLRVQNYILLLSRYYLRLKLEQQKITSLVSTSNEAIKENTKTLMTVKDSLGRYHVLTNDADHVMSELLLENLDSAGKVNAAEFKDLLASYIQDYARLASLVDELERYQKTIHESNGNEKASDSGNHGWIIYILLLVMIGLLIAKTAHYLASRQSK